MKRMFQKGFRRITNSDFGEVLLQRELTGCGLCFQNKNKALDSEKGEPSALIQTREEKCLEVYPLLTKSDDKIVVQIKSQLGK